MNISSEVLLGAITIACGVLSGAVAKMWLFFRSELKTCQSDRNELYNRTEMMHAEIREISTQVGRLKGKWERSKNE